MINLKEEHKGKINFINLKCKKTIRGIAILNHKLHFY